MNCKTDVKKIICTVIAVMMSFMMIFGCATPEEDPTIPSVYDLKLLTRVYRIADRQSKKLDLEFTIDDEDADWSQLTFESQNTAIATVSDDGIITGISAGTTTVTVTFGEKTVTANVYVTMQPRNLTLSTKNVGLLQGQTATITATAYIGTQQDGNAQIVWNSSDPNVVSVNNGTITAVGNGSATITATYSSIVESVLVTVVKPITAEQANSFDEQYVNIYGRHYFTNNQLNLDHASNAIEVGIIGTSLTANVITTRNSYMRVYVDGVEIADRINIVPETQRYTVASNLNNAYHNIRIVKTTEMTDATWKITSFETDQFATAPEKGDLKIEFIGDSISAGFGSLGPTGAARTVDNSDSTRTYPYMTAEKLGADYSVIAYSGICAKAYRYSGNPNMYTLYNQMSLINETQYAFDFNPDIVVLNLGTNESSYLTNVSATYGEIFPDDYKDMLTFIRTNNPNAFIICLYGMMGTDNVINSGIRTAIEEMDDDNIVYNPIAITANGAGAGGHPSSLAQENWANSLAEYILSLDI